MNELMEILYAFLGWEIDYDKIIAECQEKITDYQEKIECLRRQIDEARLNKEKQRKEQIDKRNSKSQ